MPSIREYDSCSLPGSDLGKDSIYWPRVRCYMCLLRTELNPERCRLNRGPLSAAPKSPSLRISLNSHELRQSTETEMTSSPENSASPISNGSTGIGDTALIFHIGLICTTQQTGLAYHLGILGHLLYVLGHKIQRGPCTDDERGRRSRPRRRTSPKQPSDLDGSRALLRLLCGL